MDRGIVADVMEILQQGYGNSSASPLDRVVATKIISYMANKGWLSPTEIAHIVKAAGGKVFISNEQMEDSNPSITIHHDFERDGIELKVIEVDK